MIKPTKGKSSHCLLGCRYRWDFSSPLNRIEIKNHRLIAFNQYDLDWFTMACIVTIVVSLLIATKKKDSEMLDN